MSTQSMKKIEKNGINQILIELNLTTKPTRIGIGGGYSLYDSLFLLLEGVAFVSKALIESGEMKPEEIYKKIQTQLPQAFGDYKYLPKEQL